MNSLRKPRTFFEEAPRPPCVTFDDSERWRRNLPWMRYADADWDYSDPATIRLEIGDWKVVISGHNLGPLFAAIERAQLVRVEAHPEFADDPSHGEDVFVTSIRFIHLTLTGGKANGSSQLDLLLDT